MKYKTILIDPPWPSAPFGQQLHDIRKGKPVRTHRMFDLETMKYKTILVDPPLGRRNGHSKFGVPYPLMTMKQIQALPVPDLADEQSHLWLWATNSFLPAALELIRVWGFRFMQVITWVKPSGVGPWWISRTQFLLFAYRGKCKFQNKYRPNVVFAPAGRHSQKPVQAYELMELISFGPRVELFARNKREGWECWGNEVESTESVARVLESGLNSSIKGEPICSSHAATCQKQDSPSPPVVGR